MFSKNALKLTLPILLVALGWVGGYELGLNRPDPRPSNTKLDAASSPPSASQAQAVRAPAGAAGTPAPPPGSFDAMADAHGLLKKSQTLGHAFPDSEAGRKLAHVATLLSFGPAPKTPEGAHVGEQLTWLQAHPQEAFEGIQRGLPRLGAEYSQERRYLVQLASKLEVDEHTKEEFLSGELRRPAGGDQVYDNAAALSALMQSSRNPDDVESSLRQALQAQSEPQAREVLLSAYAAREPERGQRLKSEFGQ